MILLLVAGLALTIAGAWAHREYDRDYGGTRGVNLPETVYRLVMRSALATIILGICLAMPALIWLIAMSA